MAGLGMPALFELYSNNRYSDFTITCGGQVFRVHRNIVCAASHFFSSICKGNFQEQDAVDLKEENPEAVARVIHYLYLADYHTGDEECTSDGHFESRKSLALARTDKSINSWGKPDVTKKRAEEYDKLLAVHFDVYRCASFLGIEPLRIFAVRQFIDLLSEPVSKKCFTTAVRMVYKNTTTDDDMLRTATTELCAFNHRVISKSPGLTSVMKEHEPAAWGVACKVATAYQMQHDNDTRAIALSTAPQGTYACTACNNDFQVADTEVYSNSSSLTVHMICAQDHCEGVETITA